jgi:CubicO group peptidase (beta-lactamase class C family)
MKLEKLSDKFNDGSIDANAMLVTHHGKIICELYRTPYTGEKCHGVFSITKSIAAIAAGFAVSEGLIGVNDRVISYFGDIIKEPAGENMQLMEVEHLLTMASGHYDDGECDRIWEQYNDVIKNFLLNPVPDKPGEKFSYNTDGVNVLSQIIERVSGVRFDKYVYERLFKPLGIENYEWGDEIGGIVNAGYGLHLTAPDLAKIGLMMLNSGKWNGKQILDSTWVERSAANLSNGGEYGYGYLFWRQKPAKSYAAIGMDGQYCIIMPEDDIVIVLFDFKGDLQVLWDIILPKLDDLMRETK